MLLIFNNLRLYIFLRLYLIFFYVLIFIIITIKILFYKLCFIFLLGLKFWWQNFIKCRIYFRNIIRNHYNFLLNFNYFILFILINNILLYYFLILLKLLLKFKESLLYNNLFSFFVKISI